MLDKLEKYLDLKADFVEVRASRGSGTYIDIKNSKVERAIAGSLSLFSIRVLDKGNFGFASTNDIKKLPEISKRALKLAKVSAKRSMESGMSKEEFYKDKVIVKPKINPFNISLEEKTKDLLDVNKDMKLNEKITSYETYFTDANLDLFYLNSEGARITFCYPFSTIKFASFAKDKILQSAYRKFGGIYGYETVEKYGKGGIEASKTALNLLKAKLVPSGEYDVVLGPKMTGVMAHEALGHACEADYVLTGESILKGRLGKRIGSELVSVYDDPTVKRAHGYYPYDDEGVVTRRTYLIKDGILKNFLQSRVTAAKMKTKSTGNARAQSVVNFPVVRMSNTHFEKGDSSFKDLIDIKKGLYIEGMKGGQVDPASGSYQFAAEEGRIIENGELKEPIRDMVVFGDILTTLKSIDAVGKDTKYNSVGTCGKSGQGVRVSDGGPNIRVRGVRVGGH